MQAALHPRPEFSHLQYGDNSGDRSIVQGCCNKKHRVTKMKCFEHFNMLSIIKTVLKKQQQTDYKLCKIIKD